MPPTDSMENCAALLHEGVSMSDRIGQQLGNYRLTEWVQPVAWIEWVNDLGDPIRYMAKEIR